MLFTSINAYEVSSIVLSDQVNFKTKSNHFSIDTPVIYTLIHLKNVKRGDFITVEWIKKDTNLSKLSKQRVPLYSGMKYIHFHYKSDPDLGSGKYILKVFSKGKIITQKYFNLYTPNKDKISKIYLAKDIEKNSDGTITPIGIQDHFQNSQHKIYALIPFKNIKEGTHFVLEWIVINDGINHNKIITKKTGKLHYLKGKSSGVISANIENLHKWPNGIFEIDLRLGKNFIIKRRFSIGDSSKLKLFNREKKSNKIDKLIQKQLLNSLSKWIVETIKSRDMKPLYEHSVHSYRDGLDWSLSKKSFEEIFNTPIDWEKIFMQKEKVLSVKLLKNGALHLEAIYPGIKSVDVLLGGTFYKEYNEWRLLGFMLEPVETK